MIDQSDVRISRELKDEIESELSKAGLLFRVFARTKSPESLKSKLSREPEKYSVSGKKIQDVFGIRVVLYFSDDNNISQSILKKMYDFDKVSSTIDVPERDSFSANRCNLVFKLPEDRRYESQVLRSDGRLDPTFEVQLRTILSEGWHEVEHDLRYKCIEDWKEHDDVSRSLNGILASLETSDWGMMKVFEELAYRHYKAEEWPQMIRTKFRLRLVDSAISDELMGRLNSDKSLGKSIFRLNRADLIYKILESKYDGPMTSNNLIFLANHFFIQDAEITNMTPGHIVSELIS